MQWQELELRLTLWSNHLILRPRVKIREAGERQPGISTGQEQGGFGSASRPDVHEHTLFSWSWRSTDHDGKKNRNKQDCEPIK